VNTPIIRLFGLVVVLFALLIAWTTRWTVFEAKSLNNNQLNARTLIDELKIKRGRILAADSTVLAQSTPAADHTWSRFYPTRQLFSQAVGYAIPSQIGRVAGLELSRGQELRGIQTGISSIFGQFSSSLRVGDDVYTTLDPAAQRVAYQQLASAPQVGTPSGSIVALDIRTGAVKVMASLPGYDDNNPSATGPDITQLNRATQGRYPPGSTFKVVTDVAAIDSGKFTPDSTVNGNSPVTISGVPLMNDGGASYGPITLTNALTQSVNTVWAQVAEAVGRPTMTDYMRRFGFYAKPPLDYPPGQLHASAPYDPHGNAYPPGSPKEDIGRIGMGQGGLQVTPLQMAMVAAAVANGGKLMVPHFTDKVVNPDGRTIETIKPSVYSQVMKPSTAQAVTQMMTQVVNDPQGTGTAAALTGVSAAGKTGTAQIGAQGSNLTEPWFIGFAPANNPRYAVAVTLDKTSGLFGGPTVGPIFKAVIQTLLQGH
jgi:peptidoglycan glycosyltransferase